MRQPEGPHGGRRWSRSHQTGPKSPGRVGRQSRDGCTFSDKELRVQRKHTPTQRNGVKGAAGSPGTRCEGSPEEERLSSRGDGRWQGVAAGGGASELASEGRRGGALEGMSREEDRDAARPGPALWHGHCSWAPGDISRSLCSSVPIAGPRCLSGCLCGRARTFESGAWSLCAPPRRLSPSP